MKRAAAVAAALHVAPDVARLVLEFAAPVCCLARPFDGLPHAGLRACGGCARLCCERCADARYECDACGAELCHLCERARLCTCGEALRVCPRCERRLTVTCCGDREFLCALCLATRGACRNCGRGRCDGCKELCSGARACVRVSHARSVPGRGAAVSTLLHC